MPTKRFARFRLILGVIGLATVVLGATASLANAETIGQLAPDNPPGTPPPATAVNGPYDEIQSTVEGTSYVVPAGATRITSWSTNAAEGPGQQLELKVFRYVSGPYGSQEYTYTAVAHDLETLTPGKINTFAVNLPVQPGDVIGLNDVNASTYPSAAYFATPGIGDRDLERLEKGDLADGASGTFVATNERLNVSAEVSGSSAKPPPPPAPSAPPVTTIETHPKAKIRTHKKKAKVSFSFSSNETGSTFMCMLDKGAFLSCASPKAYKVKPGKHTFSVEATNPSGQVGAPVSFQFKVVHK
jgi:hypothetical protein